MRINIVVKYKYSCIYFHLDLKYLLIINNETTYKF